MEWTTAESRERYDAFVAAGASSIAAFDMDGTLSPIVDDPTEAVIHPDAPSALLSVAEFVRTIAIVTGRPARQAITLGDLDDLAVRMLEQGRELHVLGQYGNERWSATQRRIISPRPPRGLSTFERELPGLLRQGDAADAWVEEKGLAVAIHTRRLSDPEAALERLEPLVTHAAAGHGLTTEPGRHVLEVRASGMDKGAAVRDLVDELDAGGVLFCGDDLGDLEAFRAVIELRDQGLAGLLVCSGSSEETALRELADVVVDGPAGVVELLGRLTADLRAASQDLDR